MTTYKTFQLQLALTILIVIQALIEVAAIGEKIHVGLRDGELDVVVPLSNILDPQKESPGRVLLCTVQVVKVWNHHMDILTYMVRTRRQVISLQKDKYKFL